MPEEIKTQEVTPKPEVKPQEEDLITRASRVQVEQPKPEEPPVFNVNDIDKIEDEKAKEYARNAHKEFERTYQKKFQELAAIRKDYETQMQRAKEEKWTPQKIQELLNNNEFVQAAQSVIGTQPQSGSEEYSNLTETEKRQIEENNRQVKMLMQQNAQLQKQQQDETLKQKYANYAPDYVDLETQNLLTGKRQATREDIWKVIDYENAIKRAYELGKQDRKVDMSEKVESVSVEGIEVNRDEKLEPQKGENDHSFLQRILARNLASKQQTK